jgi:hypothetical protein
MNINVIELASELAHNRTFYERGDICNNEDDMYNEINGEYFYKDEIQQTFNHWYDYYFTEIEKCKEECKDESSRNN